MGLGPGEMACEPWSGYEGVVSHMEGLLGQQTGLSAYQGRPVVFVVDDFTTACFLPHF